MTGLVATIALSAANAWAQGAGWTSQGVVDVPALTELSGLTLTPQRIWAHNDSGNAPVLQAFDRHGRALGSVRVTAPESSTFDWEDIAAFRQDDQTWLALGDIGDNVGLRRDVAVLLFPEPVPGAAALAPARTVRFRYEDGARDAEALAVDTTAGEILVLEKTRRTAGLYALNLAGAERQTARRIAVLPARWTLADGSIVNRDAVTAMDLSADGRRLAMLDYQGVRLFTRAAAQSWREVLQQPPARSLALPRDGSRRFEAIAIDDGGALWLAAEGKTPRLWRWLPPDAD